MKMHQNLPGILEFDLKSLEIPLTHDPIRTVAASEAHATFCLKVDAEDGAIDAANAINCADHAGWMLISFDCKAVTAEAHDDHLFVTVVLDQPTAQPSP
jgi:hypothetical protein